MRLRWFHPESTLTMYFNNISGRVVALALALAVTLLTACGGGSSPATSTPSLPALNDLPSPVLGREKNVLPVTVDAGPFETGRNVNRLYADVTVCKPGSTELCQTIKHVLVDTGSTGLRLLSSVMANELNLKEDGGFPLLNCVQFIDFTSAWGPVATADIWLGGMKAASVPMQVIADPAFNSLSPHQCSGPAFTPITSARMLGGNGIIGLGLFKQDCGSPCTLSPTNGRYYSCADDSCKSIVPSRASLVQQLTNPITRFEEHSNGVVIELPPVSPPGTASLSGTAVFGIGTHSTNNQLAGATVLSTDAKGDITTLLDTQTLSESFLDTGSNGLYFNSEALLDCEDQAPGQAPGFYCPASSRIFSATLVGASGESSPVILFSIDNALALFSQANGDNAVLPTLGGSIVGVVNTFDWGLPFFYGRRVFIGIEGMTPSVATGSFYAF